MTLYFHQSQEMKELAALAYRDTTNENREFWKSEMAQAMREIQGAYDEKLDTMRGELETYYNMKVRGNETTMYGNIGYVSDNRYVDDNIYLGDNTLWVIIEHGR